MTWPRDLRTAACMALLTALFTQVALWAWGWDAGFPVDTWAWWRGVAIQTAVYFAGLRVLRWAWVQTGSPTLGALVGAGARRPTWADVAARVAGRR